MPQTGSRAAMFIKCSSNVHRGSALALTRFLIHHHRLEHPTNDVLASAIRMKLVMKLIWALVAQIIALVAVAALVPLMALAQEPEPADVWSGTAEVSFVSTSGNTDI